MKAYRIRKNGRDIYIKKTEINKKIKICICGFLFGAFITHILLRIFVF